MTIEEIMMWGRVHHYPYLKYGNRQSLRHGWHRWMQTLVLSTTQERLQIAMSIAVWNAHERRGMEATL